MFYSDERTVLLIDGANFSTTCQQIKLQIDYNKLSDYFKSQCRLIRCVYYTAVYEGEGGFKMIQKLLDYLEYHQYQVVQKAAKEYTQGKEKRIKGNMDIEICVDMMQAATHGNISHIVLATGDGDFIPVVKAVQAVGCRVTVLSSRMKAAQGSGILNDALLRVANDFLDLEDLLPLLQRDNPREDQIRKDLYEGQLIESVGHGNSAC